MCNDCLPVQNCSQGCPVQLDFDCIIYHKDNTELSLLTNLGLQNGATLNLAIETIDTFLSGLKVTDYNLTYLRGKYTVNSFAQLAQAVDAELEALAEQSVSGGEPSSNVGGFLGNLSADPSALDGQYYFNTTSNLLRFRLNGAWKTATLV